MIITYMEALLGPVPEGYEALIYVIACVLLVFFVKILYTFLSNVFRRVLQL